MACVSALLWLCKTRKIALFLSSWRHCTESFGKAQEREREVYDRERINRETKLPLVQEKDKFVLLFFSFWEEYLLCKAKI
jgi:hypothetical protein